MPETSKPTTRAEIQELIATLVKEYDRLGCPDDCPEPELVITAYYVVAEAVDARGRTLRIEISDPVSSRHVSMGLLFSALHDPDWLDRKRGGG